MAPVPARVGDRVVGLSVVRNGWHAIRLTDHPEPAVHSGHSIEVHAARELAAALRADEPVRIPTLEGRILALQGLRLGDEAAWDRAWILDAHQRPALADALTEAAGGS
jgi:hypothetical protein